MVHPENYYELFYKVITLLGNPGASDSQAEEVLLDLIRLFGADAAFIYEGDGTGLKLSACAYAANAAAMPAAAQTGWFSMPAVHFPYDAISTAPVRNALEEIIGVVGVASAKGKPLTRQSADSLNSLLFALATYCKLQLFQRRIERFAFRDALTGVFNRRKFELDFGEVCDRAANGEAQGYIFFFDLDQFKKINDVFGHDTGDKLLTELARFLDARPELSCRVYRYGGDEFVAFTEDPSPERLCVCIDELFKRFARPWALAGTEVYCTASMGIARFPDDAVGCDELLRAADAAMYAAKRKGKNTHAFFDADIARTAPEMDKEFALRRAVADGCREFMLLLQPVVDARTGLWVGAENLIRWNSPVFGLLRPAEFIPLCEQCGLIAQVSEWVITEAVNESRMFLDYPDFYVSINTSAIEIQDEQFAAYVSEVAGRLGVERGRIMIELTNPQEIEPARCVVDKLHKDGFLAAADGIRLEDSSASVLEAVDYDLVKLDHSLGIRCMDSAFDRELARLLARLSHTVNKKICAQGVENERTKAYFTECGYDYLQGVCFAEPMPADAFLIKLRENRGL